MNGLTSISPTNRPDLCRCGHMMVVDHPPNGTGTCVQCFGVCQASCVQQVTPVNAGPHGVATALRAYPMQYPITGQVSSPDNFSGVHNTPQGPGLPPNNQRAG